MKLTHQKNYTLFILCTLLVFAFTACSDDPLSDEEDNGIQSLLVANEGNWTDSNGSFTRYTPETGQILQTAFQQNNGRPLAGSIQSVSVSGNRLFIVSNNADKIEVTDAGTLESLATIVFDEESQITPSAFVLSNEQKGYVSDLYNHSITAVDLENYTVEDRQIDVGSNPVDMVAVGNRLYVANSGFGYDNTITVIDTQTDEVITTVSVGNNPSELKVDQEGRIWVVCSGLKAYNEDFTERDPDNDIPGQVDVLSVSGNQVVATVETGGFPGSIALDNARGQAWVVNEDAVQLIGMTHFDVIDDSFIRRSFNGVGFSPAEERLYLAHSRGYTQNGQAVIYDMEGAAVDSFQVGIAPMEFLFQAD